ncbi:MAG: acetyl-CoA carboxylase biotin carboxyl carrier protein [Bacteroidia bacterium]|jgi:acetyl-CoA carboxylase biotin carboxyl carrier protein
MDLKEIQQLIKLVSTSNVDQVEIERQDFRLKIKKNEVTTNMVSMPQMMATQPGMASPAAPASSAPAVTASSESIADKADEYESIKSPMIGTFYRSTSPDKPSFVNVGDEIKVGQTLCIVEAMKLFNEIESEVSGRIVKILVDDSSPVEYDQPLFLVEPI